MSTRATLKWLYATVYQPLKCVLIPGAVRFVPPRVNVLLSYRERQALYRYARRAADQTIVEIGCYHGGSTYFLCSGARHGTGTVFAIDPFGEELDRQERLEDPKFLGRFEGYYATKPQRKEVEAFLRSQGFNNFELISGFSHDIVQTWTRAIGLLFIDGNHEYHAVRQDYEQWSPFVEVGGYMAFHDSSTTSQWPGPARLAREITNDPHYSVVDTVDTLTIFLKKA